MPGQPRSTAPSILILTCPSPGQIGLQAREQALNGPKLYYVKVYSIGFPYSHRTQALQFGAAY
jgi:hypothetical protein